MHLDYYPAAVQAAIRRFAPVSMRWAIASNLSLEDVRQEIAAAVLSGQNPAAVVPAAIGLRRLSSGWRSSDPLVAAQLVDSVIDEESFAGEVVASVAKVDASGLATVLVGAAAVTSRGGIRRRAAKARVKEQLRRFDLIGYLFGGPLHD